MAMTEIQEKHLKQWFDEPFFKNKREQYTKSHKSVQKNASDLIDGMGDEFKDISFKAFLESKKGQKEYEYDPSALKADLAKKFEALCDDDVKDTSREVAYYTVEDDAPDNPGQTAESVGGVTDGGADQGKNQGKDKGKNQGQDGQQQEYAQKKRSNVPQIDMEARQAMVDAYERIINGDFNADNPGELYALLATVVQGNQQILKETKASQSLASYLSSDKRGTLKGRRLAKDFDRMNMRQAQLSSSLRGLMLDVKSEADKLVKDKSKDALKGVEGTKAHAEAQKQAEIEERRKAKAEEQKADAERLKEEKDGKKPSNVVKKAGPIAGVAVFIGGIVSRIKKAIIRDKVDEAVENNKTAPIKTAEEASEQFDEIKDPDYGKNHISHNESGCAKLLGSTAMTAISAEDEMPVPMQNDNADIGFEDAPPPEDENGMPIVEQQSEEQQAEAEQQTEAETQSEEMQQAEAEQQTEETQQAEAEQQTEETQQAEAEQQVEMETQTETELTPDQIASKLIIHQAITETEPETQEPQIEAKAPETELTADQAADMLMASKIDAEAEAQIDIGADLPIESERKETELTPAQIAGKLIVHQVVTRSDEPEAKLEQATPPEQTQTAESAEKTIERNNAMDDKIKAEFRKSLPDKLSDEDIENLDNPEFDI